MAIAHAVNEPSRYVNSPPVAVFAGQRALCNWVEVPNKNTAAKETSQELLRRSPTSLPLEIENLDKDIRNAELFEDEPPASSFARKLALDTSLKVQQHLGWRWRNPTVFTDGAGGLRLTWARKGMEVRGLINADDKSGSYIYIEKGSHHELRRDFSEYVLLEALEALL